MNEYVLINRHIVNQKHLNLHHNLFGGVMLSWIDEAGYIFACEIAKCTNLVTVAMNKVKFVNPANLGAIICFYAKLKKIGTTSATIKIKALLCEQEKCTNDKLLIECEMVFVKIDMSGKPIKIN